MNVEMSLSVVLKLQIDVVDLMNDGRGGVALCAPSTCCF